jgi:hypothetical protein
MKEVSRRRLLTTSGTAALGLLASNRSVRAQGLETLNIGLSPFINQATIFMANDLGYFSKMGLDIRMKIFMDGALVVAPMLSGEIEVGVMTPHECRAARRLVGGRRGADHCGIDGNSHQALRRATDGVDGTGGGRIARDCRSPQGSRLHTQPRLAGRRSAHLDAHARRSTSVGAVSDGIERHGDQCPARAHWADISPT